MVQIRLVKLHFSSAMHLGSDTKGVGVEMIQPTAYSDTLFSCLINGYADLFGKTSTDNLLTKYLNEKEPPLRLSSGFLFSEGQYETKFFLPKPHLNPPDFFHPIFGVKRKIENMKAVKKTELILLDSFHDWITGNDVSPKKFEMEDFSKYYSYEVRPQHTRDRLTDASSIYHTGLIHFNINSGLYFLIGLNDDFLDWRKFNRLLTHAGKNGLGGRRSVGNGIFEAEIEDLTDDWARLINLPPQNGFITLSLYFPKNINTLKPIAYELVSRKGWSFSSSNFQQIKRKSCMMFGEGSIFENEPAGKLVNVKPDDFHNHEVYRYGVPFRFPFKILGDNHGS